MTLALLLYFALNAVILGTLSLSWGWIRKHKAENLDFLWAEANPALLAMVILLFGTPIVIYALSNGDKE